MFRFGFILLLILLSACDDEGNSDPPEAVYQYIQPDSSICDVKLDLSNGFLCALKSSRIDPEAKDVAGPTGGDAILGFGYHVVAFPNTSFSPKKVYVHFTGSYGRPYNQTLGEFGSQVFLEESLSSGYIMVQPAYNNRNPVNSGPECTGNTSVDNCAGDVRLEKIKGTDESSVVTVSSADSIETRIVKIFEFLDTNGFKFPSGIVESSVVNWGELYLGGHSQGAGHAFYIGKNFGAKNVCIIGGTYDAADTVPSTPPENVADWLLDTNYSIGKSNVKAFLTQEDSSYGGFSATLSLLGITANAISDPPYEDHNSNVVSGHSAPMHDPKYAAERSAACFN